VVSELRDVDSPPQSDTRHRIMTAALETVRNSGITGTSARAIAATGGFNQALIFYHFGSVTNLLIEAARTSSAKRVEAYRDVTEDVSSLTSLVDVAKRLHEEAEVDGSVAVLTQLMAGAASDPEMGDAILEGFEGWIDLVEDALRKAMDGEPLAGVLPTREVAYAISALFLGIELMNRLNPDKSEAAAVFDSLHDLAGIIESIPAVASRLIKPSKR
jgi:AcrR family transcriptional regulator